ncbi:glycine betaine ABC transporter substrate-binding protein [Paenibacillus sp. SYP-B4298]|uniref:glycine betaine ABC transporter substrate-binding protein n=1 Tax=Paenibacillus sp. SYP-B4298 TaxID=2996034 RepID=UPI0022DD7E66|nr:glycine betaine ABC transporter substrate-binding protein [Paenibacillus sp. SYP-B4298]
MKKFSLLLAAVMLVSVLAGCSSSGETTKGDSKKEIKLAYVAWDSEIASTYVVKEVLETKLGYKVEMLQVDAGPMFAGIADGSADAMVAGWLPSTHQSYIEKYGDKLVDLGPNLDGTKIGLVVPTYMDINSIEDLTNAETGAALDYKLIGIEPGAGLMMATEKALDEYSLRDQWTLVESSSAAMAQELDKAYKNQQPIVVTGWTPHWMFAKMELKYLEDPKNVYGGDEQIHTLVRKGLDADKADAYALLDAFNWTPDDMAAVMVEVIEGKSPEEAAKAWVEANADKVNAWLPAQ